MASWKDPVLHWKRKLEKGVPDEKVLDILNKLQRVPITVELLQDTGIGKVVNSLRKHDGEIARKALKVVQEWKQAVCANSEQPSTKPEQSSVKPPKCTYNAETNRSAEPDNKYLSKSHSSQRSYEKYSMDREDSYDPSSSTDDYKNYKQEGGSSYNPTSTQQDYRKYRLNCLTKDTDNSKSNGDSRNSKQSHSNYFPQDSDMDDDDCEDDNNVGADYAEEEDEDEEEKERFENRHSSSGSKHASKHSYHSEIDIPSSKHSNSESVNRSSKSDTGHSSSHSKSKNKSASHTTSSKVNNSSKENKSTRTSDDKHQKDRSDHSEQKSVKRTKSSKGGGKAESTSDGFTSSMGSFEDFLGFNDSLVPKPKTSSKPVSIAVNKSSVEKPKKQSKSSQPTEKQPKNDDGSRSSHKSSNQKRSREHSSDKHKSSNHEKELEAVPVALTKKPKKGLDQVDILSTLPEIQPDYKPLRRVEMPDSPPPKKKSSMTNEEAIAFTTSRKDRTALYTGRRQQHYTEVPTLFDVCVRVLIDNVDGIGFTGGVPYDVLKPVLEKCTPVQLYAFEDNNTYILDDTNELWEVHAKRDFKGKLPDENETWRDHYLRLYDEREAKLRSVTANISASMAKATPVRHTKLAYVDSVAKPPRNVARKQARFGTGLPVNQPQKAGPPGQSTPRPMAAAANAANASGSSSQKKQVVKVAPLMQKTIKFMKNRFRR